MNSAGSHVSKEFFELIKRIGEARSKQVGLKALPLPLFSETERRRNGRSSRDEKVSLVVGVQEEDRIILAEVAVLKQKVNQPSVSPVGLTVAVLL